MYGCADCSGCVHKSKCLYKYNAEKNTERHKVMKINERWEELREELREESKERDSPQELPGFEKA